MDTADNKSVKTFYFTQLYSCVNECLFSHLLKQPMPAVYKPPALHPAVTQLSLDSIQPDLWLGHWYVPYCV
jgi:hypothetical protein